MNDPVVTVLIADDDDLMRAGVRMIIETDPELSVLGEAADGDAAVTLALELRPDVVLMDVRMPGVDGLEADAAHYLPTADAPGC